MDKLDVQEINYILSILEFKAYESVVYSASEMEFLERMINKLHKQKEALMKEVKDNEWARNRDY